MEAPKCRLCGKRHWGQCTKPLKATKHVEREAIVPCWEKAIKVSSSEEGEGRRGKSQTRGKCGGKACDHAGGTSPECTPKERPKARTSGEQAGVASGPLTPAERQKRYREKHGDDYRKRNRERMRAWRRK